MELHVTKQRPVLCLLLGLSSHYAQPITGQVTEVTSLVIGRAQPELTPSCRHETGQGSINGKKGKCLFIFPKIKISVTKVRAARHQRERHWGIPFVDAIALMRHALQWRHNERDGIPNHRRLDYLSNRLFRYLSKKTSKLHVTGLCEGNSPNSPHKGPVTRNMLPFDDVIMGWHLLLQLFPLYYANVNSHLSTVLFIIEKDNYE